MNQTAKSFRFLRLLSRFVKWMQDSFVTWLLFVGIALEIGEMDLLPERYLEVFESVVLADLADEELGPFVVVQVASDVNLEALQLDHL